MFEVFKVGDYVKMFCRNGLVEAGKVIEINETHWVIEGIDKSRTIIINPLENVIAVKLKPQHLEEQPQDRPKKSSPEESVYVDVELEPDHYERDEGLRAANLAELHKLKAHEERSRAKELLQSHQPSALPEVTFGYPRLTKPVHQHPGKKTRRRPRRD